VVAWNNEVADFADLDQVPKKRQATGVAQVPNAIRTPPYFEMGMAKLAVRA
jgi:hypothetical protein